MSTSTPIYPITVEKIKQEGRPHKRKLASQEEFHAVWKSAPKKIIKTGKISSIADVSVGLPTKGVKLLKDRTVNALLKQQTSRVQQMSKLDTLLKKNTGASRNVMDNMYFQVLKLNCLTKIFLLLS